MSIGRVKFFNPNKRWGIITPDGVKPQERDKQVFFYEDALPEGMSQIADGAEVEFELIPLHPSGKRAMRRSVKPLGFSYAAD